MAYPIVPVVEHYGGRVPARGGLFVRMRCPFHEDGHPSASINVRKQRFHCFVCQLNMDAIALVRWQEDCSYADAVTKVEAITGEGNSQVRNPASGGGWLPGRPGDRRGDGQDVEAWRRLF